ncbi:MAG TPA: aminotransferase class V-fold PLP-dependent enzyme [Sedimentisphaerales bacterium]|nr:aminotransferase class V-fold PLP-dependent enzyme [Sedimentisphaerales bacterium]
MIYLNNAATSFPKPPEVHRAVAECLHSEPFHADRVGFDRSAHNVIRGCRENLARLFQASDPDSIVLTSGATESLNLALFGSCLRGHVVTTAIEHNSVLRPLRRLEKAGRIRKTVVSCDANGWVAPVDIAAAIRPDTCAIVVNHCSNVTGQAQDLAAIASVASERGAVLIVDASQSAGIVEIDLSDWRIDLLAFAGHKSLYGLPGVGGLYIREPLSLEPLKVGGTGVRSDLADQPREMPMYYEAGTPNTPGIAALDAGVRFVLDHGVGEIRRQVRRLVGRLAAELATIPEVRLYAPDAARDSACMLSFNIEGLDPEEAGYLLDQSFGMAIRSGLHCAPLIHRPLGSAPGGSIRVSPSYFTTDREIDQFLDAVKALVAHGCPA